jgi:Bacterial SH3 domain
MLRRLLAVSLILVSVAACGGSTATESPSASSDVSPAPSSATVAPSSPSAPPASTPSPAPALPATRIAACNAVALRAGPSTSGKLLARISAGVKVRVVAEQAGDAYATGACGTAGASWFKINRVGTKKVKALYGVPFVYAAAGLFQ